VHFLIDANLPRSTAQLLARFGHEATDVRDALPGKTPDAEVARYAQTHRLALLTRDFDFADIRNYPPAESAGLVALNLPEDAVAAVVLNALEALLSQPALVNQLPAAWPLWNQAGCDSDPPEFERSCRAPPHRLHPPAWLTRASRLEGRLTRAATR
jgi:predicted nuclease of predicted toxin-antitoxin system